MSLILKNKIYSNDKKMPTIQTLLRNFKKALSGSQKQLDIKQLNRLIKSRNIKNLSRSNKKEKVEAIKLSLKSTSDIKKIADRVGVTRKKGQSYKQIVSTILSKEKKINNLTKRIKRQEEEETAFRFIPVQKFGAFSRTNVIIKKPATDLEGFYKKIKEGTALILGKVPNTRVSSYVIHFKAIDSNKVNRTSLSPTELASFALFRERIEDQQRGEIEKSDAYPVDQYFILFDIFTVLTFLFKAKAQEFDSKYFNIQETEPLNARNMPTCVKRVLDAVLSEESDVTTKKLMSDPNMLNDINDEMDNVHVLEKILKNLGIKFCIIADHLTLKVDVDLNPELDSMICKKVNSRNVLMRRLGVHDFVIKNMLSGGDSEGVQCFEPDTHYILYHADDKNPHVCLINKKNPIKELYVSLRCDFYDNTFKKISTVHKSYKKSLDLGMLKREHIEEKTIYFDYESVIDYTQANISKPYSLAFCVLDEKEVAILDELERKKIKFEYRTRKDFNEEADWLNYRLSKMGAIASRCYFSLSFDCTRILYDYLLTQKDTAFKFCSFNGALFDNFLLYDSLRKIDKDMVSNPFYSKNMLLNFNIWGSSDMFDLRRHLVGSLAYCCSSFGVDVFKKKHFDHNKAQNLYNDGVLLEEMGKNKELAEYNIYDVLSLAVLTNKYKDSINKLNDDTLYKYPLFHNPTDSPTVGSYIYKVMTVYWAMKNINIPNLHIPETTKEFDKNDLKKLRQEYNKNKMCPTFEYTTFEQFTKECKKQADKKQAEKSQRLRDLFNSIKKKTSGGRVQLFNGEQKIFGLMSSMDVCSLYPYVMAVLNVFYPCGQIIETDEYKKDKIGFYYCDIDQKPLKDANKPLIICDKSGEVNNWATNEILKDYPLSSPMIEFLRTRGVKPIIKNGVYFTDKKKSCEMFKPILDLMGTKNREDGKKRKIAQIQKAMDKCKNKHSTYYKQLEKKKEGVNYNEALREVAKLISNSASGKMSEGLHISQVAEMTQYETITAERQKQNFKIVDIRHDSALVSYDKTEKSCMKGSKPIYIGALIYDYSKMYMYNKIYEPIPYKHLIYTDTDSLKITKKVRDKWAKSVGAQLVPHWEEVEKYDSRYRKHQIYSPNSKVYGSFEDEYAELGDINLSYHLQKKTYLATNTDITKIKKSKMTFKGVSDNNILVRADNSGEYVFCGENKEYIKSHENKYLVDLYARANKICDIRNELFELLYTNRKIKILTQRFQRNVKKQDISNTVSIICSFKEVTLAGESNQTPRE